MSGLQGSYRLGTSEGWTNKMYEPYSPLLADDDEFEELVCFICGKTESEHDGGYIDHSSKEWKESLWRKT